MPPKMEVEDTNPTVPEEVLASNVVTEWLILWKTQPFEEIYLGEAKGIKEKFATFYLEDKTEFMEGGIDRNQIPITKAAKLLQGRVMKKVTFLEQYQIAYQLQQVAGIDPRKVSGFQAENYKSMLLYAWKST
ncbi:unnamed protein product [Sphenostylis stenocarpa]|uniref:Uncharacterized protein n=1 Tax=Sphenostylis stenocarpa TaxID=92480 RepID=A0AA86T661_9FABA|nr:unnamed protein product [Sphenostylis stenocarpa]